MKKMTSSKCDRDCFNCKYDDCIVNGTTKEEREFSNELDRAENPRKKYHHDYYLKHKAKKKEQFRKYYEEHKQEYRAREKTYRERKLKDGLEQND